MSDASSFPRSFRDGDQDDVEAGLESASGRPPTFSIVLAAYNVAEYVGEAIESVLAQTDPDWHLLVIDDGSTDDLDAVLRRFDDSRLRIVSQPHLGLGAARQNGLSKARGEIIVLLDGDDRLRPTALATFRRSLAAAPETGLVFGRRALCGQDGRVVGSPQRWRIRRRMKGRVLRRVLAACPITTLGQAAFRRSVLDRTGGYPADYSGSGDWYFCAILAAATPFAEVDDIVLDYRLRNDSLVRNWGRQARTSEALNIEEFAPMIRQMYDSPLIRQSLAPNVLRRLERRSRSQAYCIKGYECLRTRYWATARRYLQRGLRDYPLNATALGCLVLAQLHWLPGFLRATIGHEELN